MREEKIFAGIVAYNPDMERLQQNIESIITQVTKVVIFDNGSENQSQINDRFGSKVVILYSEKNIGIAGALNRLMEWGESFEYQWMISLDQDSVCCNDFVIKMIPYLSVKDKIGIAAPVIVDRNIGIIGINPKGKWSDVRTCITSGSINNISAWKQIDGYDESMFIDSVDFEYCYRLRRNGYRIIIVSEVKLLHELGESQKRRFLFWKIQVTRHSAFRKYYIARNNVYYPLKHHRWLHFIRGNLRNLWLIIVVSLYEDHKKDKIKAVLSGWKDGTRKVSQSTNRR